MQRYLTSLCILSLILGVNYFSQAQAIQHLPTDKNYEVKDPSMFHACGTDCTKHPFLKEYQRNPEAYAHLAGNRNTLFVPVTLTVTGTDDSLGFGRASNVLGTFCEMNADYAGTGIQFFIEPPIRYLPNTTMYQHDSVIQGGMEMLIHDVPNTMNIYFVSNPAGNCGYNLPYASMTVSYGCMDGHTAAHEMGHALTMPHTFLGWEGGVSYDGSIAPDYTVAAPTTVLYDYTDFKDTMWTDTLIVDTSIVENVDRTGPNSNCAVAADGFCDTEADYLAFRWFCDGTGASTQQQIDPNGTAFYSDGSYIMSYSADNCQTTFTTEQSNAMKAFLQNERPNVLYNQNPTRDTVNGQIVLIEPAPQAIVPDGSRTFTWTAVDGATHYLLEVYDGTIGGQLLEALVLTDTTYTSNMYLAPKPPINPYSWKVVPFNYGYTCALPSITNSFNTEVVSGVDGVKHVHNLQVYPNPVGRGQELQIELQLSKTDRINVQVYTSLGQIVQHFDWDVTNGLNSTQLSTIDLAAGVYFLRLDTNEGRITKKFTVNR